MGIWEWGIYGLMGGAFITLIGGVFNYDLMGWAFMT